MSHKSETGSGAHGHLLSKQVLVVTRYLNDVVARGLAYERTNHGGGERKEITEWSDASRRRLAFVAANTDVSFKTMVTLTYPSEYPVSGKECKKHLQRWLDLWCRKKGESYLWFFEFQKRGAPHFHILTTHETLVSRKHDVSEHWYKVVGSGDERHLRAGTRVERIRKEDGARRYAIKYAMKMYQKKVPEGFEQCGRFWGNSKDVKPVATSCEFLVTADDLKKALEGWGYEDIITGEVSQPSTLYNASLYLDTVKPFGVEFTINISTGEINPMENSKDGEIANNGYRGQESERDLSRHERQWPETPF